MIIEIEINGAKLRVTGDNLQISIDEQKVTEEVVLTHERIGPSPQHIVLLADIYCANAGLASSTVSTMIFNDGNRIGRLRSGCGITISSYNKALHWFQDRWVYEWEWPHDVPRPAAGVAA